MGMGMGMHAWQHSTSHPTSRLGLVDSIIIARIPRPHACSCYDFNLLCLLHLHASSHRYAWYASSISLTTITSGIETCFWIFLSFFLSFFLYTHSESANNQSHLSLSWKYARKQAPAWCNSKVFGQARGDRWNKHSYSFPGACMHFLTLLLFDTRAQSTYRKEPSLLTPCPWKRHLILLKTASSSSSRDTHSI